MMRAVISKDVMKIKILFSMLILLLAQHSFAIEYAGTVEDFYINSANRALINLKPSAETTGAPNCGATNGWDFTFQTDTEYGKQWVAMLLSAKMSGKIIKFGYVENANTYCGVGYVYFHGNN